MKNFLIISVVLTGLVTPVLARDFQLVRTEPISAASGLSLIDPILDSTGAVLGLVAFDPGPPIPHEQYIRIEFFDDSSQFCSIPISYIPDDLLHYRRGDSLIIYTVHHVYDSLELTRMVVLQDTVIFSTAPCPVVREWWEASYSFEFESLSHVALRLQRDSADTPITIMCGLYWQFSVFDATQGTETRGRSISWVSSLDLFSTQATGPYEFFLPGRYQAISNQDYLGISSIYVNHNYCDMDYCDYWWVRRNTVSILDADYAVQFSRTFDTSWVFAAVSGDATPASPYDEVITLGQHIGLDSQTVPGQPFLACYDFIDGSPRELWRQAMPAYAPISDEPMLLAEGAHVLALRVLSNLRVLLLWDSRTGTSFDSARVDGPAIPQHFFAADSGLQSLYALGGTNDSMYLYRLADPTGVDDDPHTLPGSFALRQNYPNPFNASTEIVFALPRASEITLNIYNLLGQEVATLAAGRFGAGEHRVNWDGRDKAGRECASGIYLYRFEAGETAQSRKMLLLK